MWLDAFKPKSINIHKSGVLSVLSVPISVSPLNTRVSEHTALKTPQVFRGVPSVLVEFDSFSGTPRTLENTVGHDQCSSTKKPCKLNEYKGLAVSGTPRTPRTPQKHHVQENNQEITKLLDQFQFDLIPDEIESGCSANDVNRLNNMAWEFMQVDGLSFTEAIRLAAEIVIDGRVAACESAYVDVRDLFMRLSESNLKLNKLAH